jgi:predicted DCC family thiol-disulfide oxidoreductase YuxK
MPAPSTRHPVVLFDGVCNWCSFWVQFLIKRDRRRIFRFAALQSDAGRQLLRDVGLPQDQLTTMVLIDGDRHYLKSSAVLHVVKKMDGLWPLLFGLIVIPPVIRDFGYDLVGRNRYHLMGRRDACLVRTADTEDLFLR